MSFLTLNGWIVPVEEKGSYEVVEIGSRKPMASGKPSNCVTKHLRKWSLVSSILRFADAEGLAGMLLGRGEHFRFETNGRSTKGLDTGAQVFDITPGQDLQSSPALVYDEATGELESRYGQAGSLWPAPGVTNLFSADTRDAENAPTGYAVKGGSTLSAETTIRMQGSKSVKCVTAAGPSSGIGANTVSGLSGGSNYTVQVYVYATEVLNLRGELDDGVGTTTYDFNTIANAWVRVEMTRTINGGASTLDFNIYNKDSNVKTFYCDMWQMEQRAWGTPWVDGVRGNMNLDYGIIAARTNSLTFCCWARMAASPGNTSYNILLRVDSSSSSLKDMIVFRRNPSTNNLIIYVAQQDHVLSTQSVNYSSSPWDGEWHHVGFVLSGGDDSTPYIAVYYDGVRVAENLNPTYYPMLQDSPLYCAIGHNRGTSHFDGRINEAMLLPFALSDSQMAALANRTTKIPKWPLLEAEGDFSMSLDHQPEIVDGILTGSKYVSIVDPDDGFGSNHQRVSFDLLSTVEV